MPHWHELPATRFWGLLFSLAPPAADACHGSPHVLKTCILNDGAHFPFGGVLSETWARPYFSLLVAGGHYTPAWEGRQQQERRQGWTCGWGWWSGIHQRVRAGTSQSVRALETFYCKNIMLPISLCFQVIKYNTTLILHKESQEHDIKVWPKYLLCLIKILSHHPWEVPRWTDKNKNLCPSYLLKEQWHDTLSRESSLNQIPFMFPIN